MFVDQIKDIQVIATGSSAFELSNVVNELLTGRKYEFCLYPISVRELSDSYGWLETNRLIDERIVYGMYPEIIMKPDEKKLCSKKLPEVICLKQCCPK